MTDERFKQYVQSGGSYFRVKLIDIIRDGGTKVIETTDKNFYVHMKDNTIHSGVRTTDENKITDSLLIEYLAEAIEKFIKSQESNLALSNKVYSEIIKTNIQ